MILGWSRNSHSVTKKLKSITTTKKQNYKGHLIFSHTQTRDHPVTPNTTNQIDSSEKLMYIYINLNSN